MFSTAGTEPLRMFCPKYTENPYLREFDTTLEHVYEDVFAVTVGPGTVKSVKSIGMVFKDTIMFPEGGGQPSDQGTLRIIQIEGNCIVDLILDVTYVLRHMNGTIVHLVRDNNDFTLTNLPKGTGVHQTLNWPRRERHMLYHTGQHLLSAVAINTFQWETVNWQLTSEHCYVEFNIENVTNAEIKVLECKVNKCIEEDLEVKSHILKIGEEHPLMEKAKTRGLPENHGNFVRVVQIGEIDYNKCCGTHINSLSQLEMLKILKTERCHKKGKWTNHVFFLINKYTIYEKFDEMYQRETTMTSLLGKLPQDHFSAVSKIKEALKKAKQKLKRLEEELVMCEIKAFKALKPMPEIFSLHRGDGDMDLLNFAARQFKPLLESGSVTLFLTVGEIKGHLLLVGKEAIVKDLGPRLCDQLSGKGQLVGGNRYQAKVQLNNREQALQVLTESAVACQTIQSPVDQ